MCLPDSPRQPPKRSRSQRWELPLPKKVEDVEKDALVRYPGWTTSGNPETPEINYGRLSRRPLESRDTWLPPDLHERVRCAARRIAIRSKLSDGIFEDQRKLREIEAITPNQKVISLEALSTQTGDWGLRWKAEEG